MSTAHREVAEAVHDAVAKAILDTSGEMLAKLVVIGVTIDDDGQRTMSCWTSPDQRLWETMGLLDYVHSDYRAHLAERRITRDD